MRAYWELIDQKIAPYPTRMNLAGMRPGYRLHLAIRPEQGFYASPALIVVAALRDRGCVERRCMTSQVEGSNLPSNALASSTKAYRSWSNGRLLGVIAEGLIVDGGIIQQPVEHGQVLSCLALQQLCLIRASHEEPDPRGARRTQACRECGSARRSGPGWSRPDPPTSAHRAVPSATAPFRHSGW